MSDRIQKEMDKLPFEPDQGTKEIYEANLREGKAPEQTTKEMVAAFDRWELLHSDPITYVKNSEAERLPYGNGEEISYSIGKSADGYHYAINEWAVFGPDREGAWSKAFATIEIAEGHARDAMHDTKEWARNRVERDVGIER